MAAAASPCGNAQTSIVIPDIRCREVFLDLPEGFTQVCYAMAGAWPRGTFTMMGLEPQMSIKTFTPTGWGGLGGNGQKVTSNLTCNVSHARYCGSASKNCYVEHDPGGGELRA